MTLLGDRGTWCKYIAQGYCAVVPDWDLNPRPTDDESTVGLPPPSPLIWSDHLAEFNARQPHLPHWPGRNVGRSCIWGESCCCCCRRQEVTSDRKCECRPPSSPSSFYARSSTGCQSNFGEVCIDSPYLAVGLETFRLLQCSWAPQESLFQTGSWSVQLFL